jgi:hypothetical protein
MHIKPKNYNNMKHLFILMLAIASTLSSTTMAAEPKAPTEGSSQATTQAITTTDTTTITAQLTSEQLYQLEMKKLENDFMRDGSDATEIVVPIAFFLFALGTIFISVFFLSKSKKRRYALIEKAIEKGQPLPENLFTTKRKRDHSVFGYIQNGIIFTLLGIAMFVVGAFADTSLGFIFTGAFFFAFGIAFLLIAFIKHKMEKDKKTE